jgi:hypothetical protein
MVAPRQEGDRRVTLLQLMLLESSNESRNLLFLPHSITHDVFPLEHVKLAVSQVKLQGDTVYALEAAEDGRGQGRIPMPDSAVPQIRKGDPNISCASRELGMFECESSEWLCLLEVENVRAKEDSGRFEPELLTDKRQKGSDRSVVLDALARPSLIFASDAVQQDQGAASYAIEGYITVIDMDGVVPICIGPDLVAELGWQSKQWRACRVLRRSRAGQYAHVLCAKKYVHVIGGR